MALIACETCHKEISDEVHSCPLCGAKTQRGKKTKTLLRRVVITGVLIVIMVCVFAFILLSGKAGAETLVTETTIDTSLENMVWEGNASAGYLPIDKDWLDGSYKEVSSFVNKDKTVIIEWRTVSGVTAEDAIDSVKFQHVFSDEYSFIDEVTTISSFGKEKFTASIMSIDPESINGVYGYVYVVDIGNSFISIEITAERASALEEYAAWCGNYFSITNNN